MPSFSMDDPDVHKNHLLTISVITPSFNQAAFLKRCLDSVAVQTYPALEHLVYDPGSSDGSLEILDKYAGVTLFNEPDNGQADAVNKGIERSCGDIIAWINSDDAYSSPGVFSRIIDRFQQEDKPDIVYGNGIYTDEDFNELKDAYINTNPETLSDRLQYGVSILQPAVFIKRDVFSKIGLLRTYRHFVMDYDLWIRAVKAGLRFAFLDEYLAFASYYPDNKTFSRRGESYLEICDLVKEHYGYVHEYWLSRYAEFLVDGHDGVIRYQTVKQRPNPEAFAEQFRTLMVAFNGDMLTRNHPQRQSNPNINQTLEKLESLEGVTPEHCKQIPDEQRAPEGYVSYRVGTRKWAFDSVWRKSEYEKSHEFLRRQIRTRDKDCCIVVGNGPSLKKTDLNLLAGQDVIVSNNAFLSPDLRKHATYLTVVNHLVAEQSSHHINLLTDVYKVFPYWLSYCLLPDPNTYFVNAIGYPEFSTNMFENMSWRHTVSFFNLHLAYGLGYRKVILIGFDNTYTQPTGSKEQDIIHSFEIDENHFDTAYFQGKRWEAADTDRMEDMYKLAKTAFENDSREIVNATVGGNLELFRRQELGEALGL